MDTPADVTLFLDVDGTIAPFGHDRPDTEWGAWAEHRLEGPPSWVAPSWFSTDMNRALFGMGLNTVWLSHWEGRTVDELNGRYGIPNGIGYLRRAEVPGGVKFGGDGPLGWWKARYVHAYLEANPSSRVVWIDDQIRASKGTDSMTDRALNTGRVLAISPNALVGLTPNEVATIAAWV